MLSKIKTPINLLVGVLFCIFLIKNVSFYGKNFIVLVLVFINLISTKLHVKILFRSWYRFRYLLFSIVIFNLYFTYPEYQSVLDKLLLVMAMLALVNTYLQFESKCNIAKAMTKLLYPFKFVGLSPNSTALLFITTLDKVEKLKQDIDIKSVKITAAIKPIKSFELIASRLAIYIQNLENIESEQT